MSPAQEFSCSTKLKRNKGVTKPNRKIEMVKLSSNLLITNFSKSKDRQHGKINFPVVRKLVNFFLRWAFWSFEKSKWNHFRSPTPVLCCSNSPRRSFHYKTALTAGGSFTSSYSLWTVKCLMHPMSVPHATSFIKYFVSIKQRLFISIVFFSLSLLHV